MQIQIKYLCYRIKNKSKDKDQLLYNLDVEYSKLWWPF